MSERIRTHGYSIMPKCVRIITPESIVILIKKILGSLNLKNKLDPTLLIFNFLSVKTVSFYLIDLAEIHKVYCYNGISSKYKVWYDDVLNTL